MSRPGPVRLRWVAALGSRPRELTGPGPREDRGYGPSGLAVHGPTWGQSPADRRDVFR